MIRWYLNRIHVMTPDEEIVEDIGGRAIEQGWPPLAALGAVAYALEIHHANRAQYLAVIGGTV